MKPQTMNKRRASSRSTSRSRSRSTSRERNSEEEMTYTRKSASNGFHKPASNTRQDDEDHCKLKEMCQDVKSDEARKRGDFKNFNLPKELIGKLEGF